MSNCRRPREESRIGRANMRLGLKLVAWIAVVAALVLPRGTVHDRVMLLVLEGARGDTVRALARAGHLPVLERVIAGGVGGEITGVAEALTADQLLERILSAPSTTGPGPAEPRKPLWKLLSRQVRPFLLSAVPGVDADTSGGGISLPGPDVVNGFVGMNSGLVVNRRAIENASVRWPYSSVAAELRRAAAAASSEGAVQWVDWRDASGNDGRTGTFAVYPLDDEALYLSPVYTRILDPTAIAGLPAGTPYVGDDPTRVVLSSRGEEHLPRHAAELAEARAAAAMAIAETRPWELLVHVDRRLALTEAGAGFGGGSGSGVHAEDPVSPAAIVEAYKQVDAMVARWFDVAGARTAVLILGLTDQPRERGEPNGWFAVASVTGDLASWGPVTADDLSTTLAYLLSFDAGAGRAPLAAIVSRFPLRSRFRVRSFVDERAAASVQATAQALRDLLDKLPPEER